MFITLTTKKELVIKTNGRKTIFYHILKRVKVEVVARCPVHLIEKLSNLRARAEK